MYTVIIFKIIVYNSIINTFPFSWDINTKGYIQYGISGQAALGKGSSWQH